MACLIQSKYLNKHKHRHSSVHARTRSSATHWQINRSRDDVSAILSRATTWHNHVTKLLTWCLVIFVQLVMAMIQE